MAADTEELPPPPPSRKAIQPGEVTRGPLPKTTRQAPEPKPAKSEQTIPATELASMTGLDVAQIVKLEKTRYIPRAVNGTYPALRAIKGCFAWFNSQLSNSLPLQFDSMDQCAARTKIPKNILRKAKENGLPGFKHSRVYLTELLEGLFTHNLDKDGEAQQLKNKEDYDHFHALIEEINYLEASGKTLNKEQVSFAANKVMATMFANLDQQSDQLPAVLRGLEAAQIKEKLAQAYDLLKETLRADFAALQMSKK
jgi:hypothetical protein